MPYVPCGGELQIAAFDASVPIAIERLRRLPHAQAIGYDYCPFGADRSPYRKNKGPAIPDGALQFKQAAPIRSDPFECRAGAHRPDSRAYTLSRFRRTGAERCRLPPELFAVTR